MNAIQYFQWGGGNYKDRIAINNVRFRIKDFFIDSPSWATLERLNNMPKFVTEAVVHIGIHNLGGQGFYTTRPIYTKEKNDLVFTVKNTANIIDKKTLYQFYKKGDFKLQYFGIGISQDKIYRLEKAGYNYYTQKYYRVFINNEEVSDMLREMMYIIELSPLHRQESMFHLVFFLTPPSFVILDPFKDIEIEIRKK